MDTLPELSPREFDIVLHLTRGESEKEIANNLFISHKTVNNHLYNVRKKWKARCAVDVARKFLLSLDNPKQFFTVVAFLMIQLNIMMMTPDIDLRKPSRTSTTRVMRTVRKNLN